MQVRSSLLALGILSALCINCGGSTNPPASAGTATPDTADSKTTEEPTAAVSPAQKNEPTPAKSEKAQPTADADIVTGLQALEKRSASLDFDLNLTKNGQGSGVQSGQWSFSEERTLRVKKAKDNTVMELEVVYGKWEAKPLLGMTYEVPTDDKTYVVSFGDSLKILRAGEKTSAAEEKAVALEYGWVGNPSSLRKALIDAGLTSDSTIAMTPQVSAALLGAIPGADVAHSGIKATIKSIHKQGRGTADLDVAGSFAIKSKKATFNVELKGPATIDLPTGWVKSMDLKGTATVTGQTEVGKRGTMDVDGKGKFTLTKQLDFK